MHLTYPVVLAVLLFAVGTYGVLARRNAILVLMSAELMLGSVNLALIAFDVAWRDTLAGGQVFALFVLTIAAAEVGVGLALVLLVWRRQGGSDVPALRLLRDRSAPEDGP